MRILLFGANGQVGVELRRSLASLGEVVSATRNGQLDDGSECEIADLGRPESLVALVERIRPEVVVNAAAYTAVDRAENEYDAALRVNAVAPGKIADACAGLGILFVHYSTDYVFDGGGAEPYLVDAQTGPLGVYGASKLAGEQAVRASGAQYLIFRTAWVYAAHGKNFLRTMLRLASERDELRVVADQIGTPTPATLIADMTLQVLKQYISKQKTTSGIWHLTATGETSWHGFATAIVKGAVERGLITKEPNVVAINTTDFPTPAKRPAYSCLDTTTLQIDFGVVLPSWCEALMDVLDQMTGSTSLTNFN